MSTPRSRATWREASIAAWVRNLYRFAVKPTIAFYFRISVDEAMKRIVGGRDAINYYEAGMDRQLSGDVEESFRLFQGAVIDEYDRMVERVRPRRHRRERLDRGAAGADARRL